MYYELIYLQEGALLHQQLRLLRITKYSAVHSMLMELFLLLAVQTLLLGY